jgi:uncharacterized protein YciI
MALFAIICLDKPGALDLRLATRDRHLAYAEATGRVRAGGAFLDPDGKPEGSLLIVEADDIAAARAFAAADPYATAGVFASVEVRTWRLALGGLA